MRSDESQSLGSETTSRAGEREREKSGSESESE